MKTKKKTPRYPENLELKIDVVRSGRTTQDLADSIGFSRVIISQTINGHYKGINVVPALKKELGLK